jgi:hypothetical protein
MAAATYDLPPSVLADAFADIERQDIRVARIYMPKKSYDKLRADYGRDVLAEKRIKGATVVFLWEARVGIDTRLKPGEFALGYRRPPKGSTKPSYLLGRNEGKRFRRRFTVKEVGDKLAKIEEDQARHAIPAR